jgi:hypothetical protein
MKQAQNILFMSKFRSNTILSIPLVYLVPFLSYIQTSLFKYVLSFLTNPILSKHATFFLNGQ